RHTQLSSDLEQKLKRKGRLYLEAFRSDMEAGLGSLNFRCDQKVIIASDWGGELLMQASRLKTQLLLLGLSERSLAYRVFHSVTIERILLQSPCDVGIYRSS
ncbi:MAG: hypothetical protein JRE63_12490, partial [Deltaproteobacteria bacterium]|nr:hypothetical protein [Deltaproteobacteria bacterium]